jgi:hypothetical protein
LNRTTAAIALLFPLVLLPMWEGAAGSYAGPPYTGHAIVTSASGKVTSFDSLGEICGCVPRIGDECQGRYGIGELVVYQYKSLYSRAGTIRVSATADVHGVINRQNEGYAHVRVYVGVFDATGAQHGTLQTLYFNSTETYTGVIEHETGSRSFSVSLPVDGTYHLRWYLDLRAESEGTADFYGSYGVVVTMMIATAPWAQALDGTFGPHARPAA